jgi:hypothetical protein
MNKNYDVANVSDTVWLVEDDDRQAATLEQYLMQHHPRLAEGEIVRIATESQFLSKIREVFEQKGLRPRLVIADVMLPWAFLGMEPEGIEQPPEVRSTHGFRAAGVRCWKALREKERAAKVVRTPFVFHTVLPKEEFGFDDHSDANTSYVAKDQPFDRLEEAINDVTNLDEDWHESPEEVEGKFLANSRMKKILEDGLHTPLQQCTPYQA